MEQLLNNNLEEKDKLLNVVNNMQIQTQLELEAEIAKNSEIHRQVANQKMIISKQLEEIAQLNQLVIQRKKESRSLYSSPLIQKNQITSGQIQNDYYQKLYEEECSREEKIFKIWKQLQNQNYQKVKQLQDVIENQMHEQFQKYEELIEQMTQRISIQDEHINKYRVALTMIIKQDNRKQISELLQLANFVSEEQLNELDHEQLIETLIDFSNKRDQLYHLQCQNLVNQQEQQQFKQDQMQEELHQIEEQRADLLVLGQKMNDKINLQQEQITSMNSQIQQLTNLFAKSLQDLEQVQEENELLRKSHNFTTRTSEVYSRLSVSAEDKLLKCLSVVNSTYTSKARKSLKNKSMLSQSSCQDEDLCNLLDSILNYGFSQKIISKIACLGNQGFRKKLKDLLFILFNNSNEISALFESLNTIFSKQVLEVVNEGMAKSTSRLEANCRICCEQLQKHQQSNVTVITTTLGELSKVLLKLCQGNDDVIVAHIDKHIEIAKQLNNRKDKQLQFSTCKMIMEIFKKWKQNYIRITSILYSVSKGLQQGIEISIDEDLHEIQSSDLGKVIVKELNKLFQLLI